MSTITGGTIASMGASTMSADAHSGLLGVLVIGIGLLIVLESLGDGNRPLRTWGAVLAAVGLIATVGPFAGTLSAGTSGGLLYLGAGLATMLIDLALRRTT
jgi:hypothetical protein